MKTMIKINEKKCTGCGVCIDTCPYDALYMVENKVKIGDNCILCSQCISACSENAIEIEKKTLQVWTGEYSGICVFVEIENNRISPVVFELINLAHEINKDLKKNIYAVILGNNIKELAEEIILYGVDEVWMVEDEKIKDFQEDLFVSITSDIIIEKKPEIFIAGSTIIGRSIFPRIAARLNTGLTADCTSLTIKDNNLLQIRPAFCGNVMASILCKNHRPQMATVRHKVYKPAGKLDSYNGRIVSFNDLNISDSIFEILEVVKESRDMICLDEANIIVAGGRGMKNPDNFSLLFELSNKLNGSVGATRACVDAGWVPYSYQIGQTGKTVNPKVYFACGISGASQHIVGINSSDIIIAINLDPDAPIFNYAHFGIVGDLFDVLPEMIQSGKQLMEVFND